MTEDEMVGWHHWLNLHEVNKLWEMVKGREAWHVAVYEVAESRTGLSDWTPTLPSFWENWFHLRFMVLYNCKYYITVGGFFHWRPSKNLIKFYQFRFGEISELGSLRTILILSHWVLTTLGQHQSLKEGLILSRLWEPLSTNPRDSETWWMASSLLSLCCSSPRKA